MKKKLFLALVALAALGVSASAQVDTSIYRPLLESNNPLDTTNQLLELKMKQQQIELQRLEIQRSEMHLQQLRQQHREMMRRESQVQQQTLKPRAQKKQTGQPLQLHQP